MNLRRGLIGFFLFLAAIFLVLLTRFHPRGGVQAGSPVGLLSQGSNVTLVPQFPTATLKWTATRTNSPADRAGSAPR
jgi:hypothetical protein